MPRKPHPDWVAGRYEKKRRVGKGGMAEVWLATDHGKHPFTPDRQVALKILQPAVAEEQSAVKRFEREGEAMIQFDHPRIVTVFEHGRDSDVHFLVMEFIEGCSVSELLRKRQRPLRPEDAVAVISQVCEALEYAHGEGMIHRDIKPLNVMIQGDFEEGTTPSVKVTDFGIAFAKRGTRITRAHGVVGTDAYMAAEVARGAEPQEYSDVYACGAMLYELLTGDVPFKGKTLAAIVDEQEQGPPPAPSAINGNVPRALSDMNLIALALFPSDRFRSARDLRGAIQAAVAEKELDEYLPTRLVQQEGPNTPLTLYRARLPRSGDAIHEQRDRWASLLTFIAVISGLLVLFEITLRLVSAVAATPTWAFVLGLVVCLVTAGLRRSTLFSPDEISRDAARARLRRTLRTQFRGLTVILLAILWGLLGFFLVNVVREQIEHQPPASRQWLELGSAVVWISLAVLPLLLLARSRMPVSRTAASGAAIVLCWSLGALALTEAPGEIAPLFWSKPTFPQRVRTEGEKWVEMLRRPDQHLSDTELATLRKGLAHSRNDVLRELRHADTSPERRQAKRQARRWLKSMRRARRTWRQSRCHDPAARLRIDGRGARAICA